MLLKVLKFVGVKRGDLRLQVLKDLWTIFDGICKHKKQIIDISKISNNS